MGSFEIKKHTQPTEPVSTSHSTTPGSADFGASMPALARAGAALELYGLTGIRNFPTGARPRVYLSAHSRRGAIISDTGLSVFDGGGLVERTLQFTRGEWPLKDARLGRGIFSPDGDYFTLVVETLPGKLLRLDTPLLLDSPSERKATRYSEFPSVSGRHIFSPTGDFLLSYPGSGLPVGILWQVAEQDGFVRVRAGGTFELPGRPTAEAIANSGDTLAVGIRHANGRYGACVYDLPTGKSLLIDHAAPISQLDFSEDGRLIWLGDLEGVISCIELREGLTILQPRVRYNLSSGPITALAVTAAGIIVGTESGGIFGGAPEACSVADTPELLGRTAEGFLCSVSAIDSGARLLLGFSLGGAVLCQVNGHGGSEAQKP